jgi:hypothetical protein
LKGPGQPKKYSADLRDTSPAISNATAAKMLNVGLTMAMLAFRSLDQTLPRPIFGAAATSERSCRS